MPATGHPPDGRPAAPEAAPDAGARSDGPSVPRPDRHIVDQLIEERAPHLARSPTWPLVSALLKPLLSYRAARRLADGIAARPGVGALEDASTLLSLDVGAEGLEHVPATGRCLVLCNHPTGIADGIALFDALKTVRGDISFFANADALRVCPGLADVVIPVTWPAAKRTLGSSRATLARAREAIRAERAIVVFPAGALARRRGGAVRDPEWEHSAVALARSYDVPVIPAHLEGPWPFWFHLLDRCSQELRDVTLFHEFLNKAGRTYRVRFAPPVDPAALEGSHEAVTRRLKDFVETVLPATPDAAFDP